MTSTLTNTFKCNVDTIYYKVKPEGNKIGGIVNRMKCPDGIKEMTAKQLSRLITQGYSFTTAELNDKGENGFISQWLAVVDIDNELKDIPIMTVEDAITILEANSIDYSFIYYSFSHSTTPKFRIVCLLSEPITDPNEAKRLNQYLISLFPQADQSCFNLDRFYYGTDKGLASEVFDRTTDIIIPPDWGKSEPEQTTEPPISEGAKEFTPPKFEGQGAANGFDLTREIQQFDLLSYVEYVTGTQGKKHGKDILINPCPLCGHKDHFFIDVEKNVYYSHGSRDIGKEKGNIITYLMNTRNLDLKSAREYFMYDILKRDRNADKEAYKQKKKQERVKNQTENKDIKIDSYMFNNKVMCPFLAEYIKNNSRYIFARDHAKETVQRYLYKKGYYNLISDLEFKGFIKSLIPLENQETRDISEVFNLITMDDFFINRSQLDNNENIINFNNGVLHLDTMELKPHNPDYLCTKRIPHNFIADAPKPSTGYFDKYMEHLTKGDKGKASLILQVLGMAISNIKGYRPKKGLFMYGEGDTGKSVIRGLAAKLVGEENNSGINLETLEARFGTSVIYGKRLVGSPDMSFMTVKELHAFKMITGGDDINAEFKRENAFTYKFDGVVWFCMNALPKFGGDRGDHVYDRMMIVECNPNKPEELDRKLPEKLLTEIEYIISLAIKELQKVIDNGYNYIIPESCKAARDYFKKKNSSFLQFFEECTEPRPDGKVIDSCTRKKFYDVYAAWCKDNNHGIAETKQAILKELESMGKDTVYADKVGNRYYRDFTLTLETKRDYTKVYGYDNTMRM